MRFFVTLFFLTIIIIVVYFLFGNEPIKLQKTEKNIPVSNQASRFQEINISISEENMSKENGMATIKQEEDKTYITLRINNFPEEIIQPSYIYSGSCNSLGQIVYQLESMSNSKSETILDVSFNEIKKQFPLSIVIHKAPTEMGTIAACGNIW